MNNRLEIGGIARAHGIRGEVMVHTHDPDSSILGQVERVYIDGAPYTIEEARGTPKGWIVALVEVTTRNDAEKLHGKPIEVDRSDLELAEGDVLLDDLVGCAVKLVDGTPWGKIVAVDPGMQDLLVIHDGTIERLLPLVDVFVKTIDVDGKVVTVDPPDGLPETRLLDRDEP